MPLERRGIGDVTMIFTAHVKPTPKVKKVSGLFFTVSGAGASR